MPRYMGDWYALCSSDGDKAGILRESNASNYSYFYLLKDARCIFANKGNVVKPSIRENYLDSAPIESFFDI